MNDEILNVQSSTTRTVPDKLQKNTSQTESIFFVESRIIVYPCCKEVNVPVASTHGPDFVHDCALLAKGSTNNTINNGVIL